MKIMATPCDPYRIGASIHVSGLLTRRFIRFSSLDSKQVVTLAPLQKVDYHVTDLKTRFREQTILFFWVGGGLKIYRMVDGRLEMHRAILTSKHAGHAFFNMGPRITIRGGVHRSVSQCFSHPNLWDGRRRFERRAWRWWWESRLNRWGERSWSTS